MELQTKNGFSFLIDDEDYNLIKNIKWNKSLKGYVRGYCNKQKKTISIHRLIMGVSDVTEPIVDHKDRDPLNNMKSNLRLCNNSQNQRNRTPSGKSKYLGVCTDVYIRKYVRKSGEITICKPIYRFRAQITNKGKTINLGNFKTEIEAAKKYNEYALIYNGNFANLNVFV